MINKSSKQSRCIKWVEILLKSQLKHQIIDAEDVAKAKAEYQRKLLGFNEVFMYQKGSKVEVYKRNY